MVFKMKSETRIKVLAKCYMKNKKFQSEYMNGMAIEIASELKKLESEDPDRFQEIRSYLREIGYENR